MEELTSQRAEERIGERVEVLVESLSTDDGTAEGRAEHQGPEVDGSTTLVGVPADARVGQLLAGVVTASEGADLVAEVRA